MELVIMSLNPTVHDLAHFNTIDFRKFQAAGGQGIIHKASQGVGMVDDQYAGRRALAAAAGLLWGAYHFNGGGVATAEAAHFLSLAKPDANTLCALDYEGSPSPMSAQGAWDFMRTVEDATGRLCWIYGGDQIMARITPLAEANSAAADFFAARPLWLCQYKTGLGNVDLAGLKSHIHVPAPWTNWTLLQYTDGNVGPLPHTMPGCDTQADLNVFAGTPEELAAIWAGAALAA
jgi:lysozyme